MTLPLSRHGSSIISLSGGPPLPPVIGTTVDGGGRCFLITI
jgi:hypothetical protein